MFVRIRTNIRPANTNIRGGLWTTNANANISKCYEYVFVPTPTLLPARPLSTYLHTRHYTIY